MKKIAIVVQRYGIEVNGGSELYSRLLAEKLEHIYDIEVLTTCARDYTTWENYYPEGISDVNGVCVRRFTVEKTRDMQSFNTLTVEPVNPQTEQIWIDEQGPYCTAIIDYIKANKEHYDVFIFMTYLYYITVRGMIEVKDKAILIPTAHDEVPIYFNVFKDVFNSPRAIVYNAEEERDFVYKLFLNQNITDDIIGIGIDIPTDSYPDHFKEKYSVSDYLLYTGRIEEGKNCLELFKYFTEYKKRNPSGLKLVLMGKEIIEVPKHPDIISLGFVNDDDRINGMAGAKLFILPSFNESLSLVVLESMASGVPVVINSKCKVVKGHCLKSNAGLYYSDYFEFEGCINYLLIHDDVYRLMSRNARLYIEKNYHWDLITEKFKRLIEII